jgi:hypothetical protein
MSLEFLGGRAVVIVLLERRVDRRSDPDTWFACLQSCHNDTLCLGTLTSLVMKFTTGL